ncbi:hypothetical protein [Nocardia callitridis]|uniref:Secreted protein n=1 Tax=Nocardia callitridis TaxID=648753 RepID=A0ABP9KFG2_9NOCA
MRTRVIRPFRSEEPTSDPTAELSGGVVATTTPRLIPARVAVIAALCTTFSVAPMLVGTGAANASALVPCTYGPVETRLEVDCHNDDFTPATVKISAWCTNFAYIGWQQRMDQRSDVHITRDCGPGANPVVWFVSSESDWEHMKNRLESMERDRDDHHRGRHT